MQSGMQKRVRAALEAIELAGCATIGGLSRKLSDLETAVAAGHVLQPGALFVQSERKTDYRLDNAIDLISCTTWTPRQQTAAAYHWMLDGAVLTLAHYSGPWQLEAWPEVGERLAGLGVTQFERADRWEFPEAASRRLIRLAPAFFGRVRKKGLLRRDAA